MVPPERRASAAPIAGRCAGRCRLRLLATCLALAPSADAALRFERCGPYGFACARLSVPLDRSGAVPGPGLAAREARPRPTPGGATRPPLFVLAGGPGQSATEAFGATRSACCSRPTGTATCRLRPARHRPLGAAPLPRGSSARTCSTAGPAAGACARRLGARRAFYTSRDSADDIEAIRAQLGAERIALYGTSYGTKVALAYALRYPARVERLVLDSVVEADGPDPFYLDAIDAVPRALRSLCRAACRWTSDPVADLAALVDRIARAARCAGSSSTARGRRAGAPPHARGRLLDPARGRLRPGAARRVPRRRARGAGRRRHAAPAPAPARVRGGRRAAAAAPPQLRPLRGHHLRGDPLPWARSTPPDPAERHRQAAAHAATIPDSAFEPFDRATALASDMLASATAGRTPRWRPTSAPARCPTCPCCCSRARTTCARRSRTRARVARCSRARAWWWRRPRATRRSAATSAAAPTAPSPASSSERAVPTRCPRARRLFRPSPPPPRRLADVAPLAGTSGLRGRTLAAVKLTLRDVAEDSVTELIFDPDDPDIARGGGLRAGRYRIDGDNTLELRRRGLRAGRHAQRPPRALRRAPPARPAAGERPRRARGLLRADRGRAERSAAAACEST